MPSVRDHPALIRRVNGTMCSHSLASERATTATTGSVSLEVEDLVRHAGLDEDEVARLVLDRVLRAPGRTRGGPGPPGCRASPRSRRGCARRRRRRAESWRRSSRAACAPTFSADSPALYWMPFQPRVLPPCGSRRCRRGPRRGRPASRLVHWTCSSPSKTASTSPSVLYAWNDTRKPSPRADAMMPRFSSRRDQLSRISGTNDDQRPSALGAGGRGHDEAASSRAVVEA